MPKAYLSATGMLPSPSTSTVIFRLTALWALAESGLGGWMHALHLPLTGFFVGALAIIFVSLIAHYSGSSARQIIQATLLVLLVKAAASPHSPPPAYIAVAFQGFMGALLFRLGSFPIACLLLGMVTMIESAFQKLLIATIIFGRSLWDALDSFLSGLAKELHLPADSSYSYWLVGGYAAAYAAWGLFIGLWMAKLPRLITEKAAYIRSAAAGSAEPEGIVSAKKNFPLKLLTGLLVLCFIMAVLVLGSGNTGKAFQVLIRSVLILALLMLVVRPLFAWLLARWVRRNEQQHRFKELLDYLPRLRAQIGPAYRFALREANYLTRFKTFVLAVIVLSLYPGSEQ